MCSWPCPLPTLLLNFFIPCGSDKHLLRMSFQSWFNFQQPQCATPIVFADFFSDYISHYFSDYFSDCLCRCVLLPSHLGQPERYAPWRSPCLCSGHQCGSVDSWPNGVVRARNSFVLGGKFCGILFFSDVSLAAQQPELLEQGPDAPSFSPYSSLQGRYKSG